MNLIPAFIQSRIAHRPNLIKIVDNIGWLFFDKILRMGVGLLVGVWVARYLGPEQFGLFNFATAFIGLFGAIAGLGLQSIVVRDIVRDPDCASETLGTAATLQLIGGFVAYLFVLTVIAYLRPADAVAGSIIAVLGSILLLEASKIAVFWFESQVQSKYTVWVQNSVFLIFAAVKVGLILQHASLIAFAYATLAEASLAALILLIVMGRHGPALSHLRVNTERALSLIKESWPLILSSVAVMIYMKIDQIMLGQMAGNKAVGIYSAATRISEIWYFIPIAIVTSVFPTILDAKKRSEKEYYARLQKLYNLMVMMSVSVALPMTFLSTKIVNLLFGPAYQAAGTVLAVHTWAAVFVFLGVASGKWFLVENLLRLNMMRTIYGAIINIVINLFLIPMLSALGAAIATVISLIFLVYFIDLINPITHNLFLMKTKALISPFKIIEKFYKFNERQS